MKTVGIGTRILNFLVDTIVIFIISYALSKLNQWYAQQYKIAGVKFNYYYNFGTIFFFVLFVYYTIMEIIFARTCGKFLSYSKVVNKEGKRPNVFQVLIRSAVRLTIIDMFFIPFLDKTLHDYLSKTNVVEID
ncbi:MAG: RDD family protein [Chitinophagaceae bacterium]|nr:RDD family protein [Chitinophagaceae bacterium]